MTAKLPILLAAALLSGCATFEEDQTAGPSRAGVDEQPSPALVAALERSQGLPQNQAEPTTDARPAAQSRGVRRSRARVAHARQVRTPDTAPAEPSAQ